jgi:hypothetical protein
MYLNLQAHVCMHMYLLATASLNTYGGRRDARTAKTNTEETQSAC